MDQIIESVLRRIVREGSLSIEHPSGYRYTLGDGSPPRAGLKFHDTAALLKLLLDPELRFPESYVDGTMTVTSGTIADVLEIVQGQKEERSPAMGRLHRALRYLLRRLQQANIRSRSRSNVARHYDIDGRIYSLFLDSDRQYSCAYFETPRESLDDAQLAKKRHIAAKMLVKRDARVLDIGCGWGGMALYLANHCGAEVTGITLSQEQLALARARAQEQATGNVRFLLQDYRDTKGPFDNIVSVGMFEHVGVSYYDAFFKKCAELLSDDGVMLLHSIGRSEGPSYTNPWIAKYIFPGGYIPALSEVLPAIERAGLLVNDIEILRLHYAETLKAWRERFLAHAEEAERIYDKPFVRLWEFYLAASEMAFRKQNMMNFQIQLTKRQGVVPMTRDYIGREESRLRNSEADHRPVWRMAGE